MIKSKNKKKVKEIKLNIPHKKGLLVFAAVFVTFLFIGGFFYTLKIKNNQTNTTAQNAANEINRINDGLKGEDIKTIPQNALKQTLTQRKEKLLAEIKTNPKALKDNALPKEVRDDLPDDLKGLVEQEVRIEGKLTVLTSDDFKNKKSEYAYTVSSKTKEYNVNFIQKPNKKFTQDNSVNVSGLALDSELVVDSSENIKNYEPLKKPLLGARTTLIIRFNWTNDTSQPISAATLNTNIFNGATSANTYYQENSFGDISFPGDVANVSNWYTLAYNKGAGCSYSGPGNLVGQWTTAADAAAEVDFNLVDYQHLIYVFPYNPSCGWAGLGTVGDDVDGKYRLWSNEETDPSLYTHELGHNIGAGHANRKDCGAKTIDVYTNCTDTEYGDPYDTMGGYWVTYHMNAGFKELGEWISGGEIQTVSTNGTYTINPIESAGSVTKAIRIQKPNTSEYYWLEYKQATGFDSALGAGVTRGITMRVFSEYFGDDTSLLDFTPADGWSDVALSDGASFTDTINNITVTQVSHNSSSVTLSINFNQTLLGSYDYGGVFFIENNQKRPITSAAVFDNWGFSWGDVVWVSLNTINSYPTGHNLTQLASHNGGAYFVAGSQFRPIFDADTFNIYALNWGLGWNDIKPVSDFVFSSKSQGAVIYFPSLVTYSNGGSVYYMDGGKRAIDSGDTFNAWGFNWGNIFYTKNNSFLASYPNAALFTVLPSNSGSVYLVENSTKRPIYSAQSFNNHATFDPRFRWDKVTPASDNLINSLPTGAIVY